MVGEYALRLFAERLDVHFAEDEAGFIALHFVNAEYDTDVHDTYAITHMMQRTIEIIKQDFPIEIDQSSMHYERFIAHLKFFARRVVFSNELLKDEEPEMAEMIEQKYAKEFSCAKRIAAFVEEEYHCTVTREEMMYFAIHIRRIQMAEEK